MCFVVGLYAWMVTDIFIVVVVCSFICVYESGFWVYSGTLISLDADIVAFCILFVAAWTKRMASGGTRPAGSAFGFQQRLKEQQINALMSLELRSLSSRLLAQFPQLSPFPTIGARSVSR